MIRLLKKYSLAFFAELALIPSSPFKYTDKQTDGTVTQTNTIPHRKTRQTEKAWQTNTKITDRQIIDVLSGTEVHVPLFKFLLHKQTKERWTERQTDRQTNERAVIELMRLLPTHLCLAMISIFFYFNVLPSMQWVHAHVLTSRRRKKKFFYNFFCCCCLFAHDS